VPFVKFAAALPFHRQQQSQNVSPPLSADMLPTNARLVLSRTAEISLMPFGIEQK
jgi:hypothetical protein